MTFLKTYIKKILLIFQACMYLFSIVPFLYHRKKIHAFWLKRSHLIRTELFRSLWFSQLWPPCSLVCINGEKAGLVSFNFLQNTQFPCLDIAQICYSWHLTTYFCTNFRCPKFHLKLGENFGKLKKNIFQPWLTS